MCDDTPGPGCLARAGLPSYGRQRPMQAVPHRGGSAGHLEMAHSLISTGLLEVISNRHAGNAKRLGKPPFPDVYTYFCGHEAGSAVGDREWQSNGWEGVPPNQKQTSAPALLLQVMYCHAGAGERRRKLHERSARLGEEP